MAVLDPLGPSDVYLGGPVTLSERTVHQQAAAEPVTGEVFATQVIQGGRQLQGESSPVESAARNARGDLAISRVSAAGELVDNMYVRRFDHGSGLGVENRDGATWIWTAYDAAERPAGQNAHGRLIARYPYQPGAVLDVGTATAEVFEPIPGATSITPSLDLTHSQVGIRYSLGGGNLRYRIYSYADFTARNFDAFINDFPQTDTDLFQSWTLYGRYIYQFHGSGYSDDNPPPGNARFVILDTFTGRTIRTVPFTGYPDLVTREPEALTVWESPAGPRLVYGFATDAAPRLMRLYAVKADAGPGTWIEAEATDQGIALAASLGDPATVQSWTITRPDGTVLTSGTGATGDPVLAVDALAPPCRDNIYVLTIERTDGSTSSLSSSPVAYIPPGGCESGGAVGPTGSNVGCATAYTARIHWRGGALELPVAAMDDITEISWGRTADDVSEATVTLARCGPCHEIEDIHPWVHELTIYRDGELVWQGPVRRVRVRRNEVIIEALDVVAWLDRLNNTFRVDYSTTTPDSMGRRKGTIVYIARNHIRLALEESALSVPPDYPAIMDYIVADESGLPTIKVEKDGSSNTTIWTEYLGTMLREWNDRGLHFTTVGRSLVLRGWPTENTPAQARISLGDLVGEVEVVRDGEPAATYAFATTQQGEDISKGLTVGTGRTGTPYGRLDTIVRIQEDDPTEADLRSAARDALAGRYPAPMVIQIPQSAQLAPQAPLLMAQLVPGERVDIYDDEHCFALEQGFALSDMEVTWDGSRERVSVGLIPLDQEVP
ncbi:hypothetical protein ACFC34_00640 [Streptomyces sp. NPDC056053]|uniref:phage baseplate protein n=1 Tax=Streptomyces sp. NPDC056053 TaxID=3345696 RepID=UPI0035D82B71